MNAWKCSIKKTIDQWEIEIGLTSIGEDLLAFVAGGQKPHIGCTVIAVPRESLTGKGVSATSSVINVTGHKDDIICREIAEILCRKYQHTVVCTGGVHIDHIEAEMIQKIMNAVVQMAEKL